MTAEVARSTGWRQGYLAFIDRHETAWELVMAALAMAFVIVGFVAEESATPALVAIDWALTVVFVAEFVTRFAASMDRRRYLRGHWIDLVAIVPTVRGARLLRLLRLLRLVRAFAGVFRFVSHLERLAAHRGLAWLLVAWMAVMVICSLALFAAEHGVNAAIDSPADALWWGIVTLTTVGYGDVYPVTGEGRLAASVLMLLGIGLFSAITATVTSYLIGTPKTSTGDRLRELASLRDDGLVTAEEFEAARARLAQGL